MSQIDGMQRKFEQYAPLHILKDMQDDFGGFIKQEEYNILYREFDTLRKDIGRLCSKEELMTRLNVFNSDVNTKL